MSVRSVRGHDNSLTPAPEGGAARLVDVSEWLIRIRHPYLCIYNEVQSLSAGHQRVGSVRNQIEATARRLPEDEGLCSRVDRVPPSPFLLALHCSTSFCLYAVTIVIQFTLSFLDQER